MSYLDKYAQLVEKLYAATADGALKWELSDDGLAFTRFGTNKLYVGEGENDKGEPIVWVSVFSDKMDLIDNFNDELFKGLIPKTTIHSDYWTLMGELARIAKRSASGADKVIDDILKSLDTQT